MRVQAVGLLVSAELLWLQNALPHLLFGFTDGLAYSALLKNELLGAGIEKVQDPQTEDRRLQPSTPEKKSLFTVSWLHSDQGRL